MRRIIPLLKQYELLLKQLKDTNDSYEELIRNNEEYHAKRLENLRRLRDLTVKPLKERIFAMQKELNIGGGDDGVRSEGGIQN